MNSFENSYNRTFNMLNSAREFHNRRNARKHLCLYDLAPGAFQKSFFAGKLHPDVAALVKLIYDASQTGTNIVIGLMHALQHRTNLVQVTQCDVTSSKVYICDIKQTKSMVTPATQQDFVTLFNVCAAMVDSELLHHSFINTHKSMKSKIHFTHSSMILEKIRDSFHQGLENHAGQFAAVLMWFLHSKHMNKIQTVDKLCTGSMVTVNLNISTRLHKSNPSKHLVSQPQEDLCVMPQINHIDDEEEQQQIDKENDTQKLQNDDDEILDSWEDFDI